MTEYHDDRPAEPTIYTNSDQDPLDKMFDGLSIFCIGAVAINFLSPLDDPEFTTWGVITAAGIQGLKYVSNRGSGA